MGSILRVEGVKGLFAGYGSFLLRDLPFDALEFVFYEQLKRSYSGMLKDRKIRPYETSVIGEWCMTCGINPMIISDSFLKGLGCTLDMRPCHWLSCDVPTIYLASLCRKQ